MYQRLCFVMLAIWAVASLGSCRKESVGDSRAETEARTPMRIDMSNQIGEVEQFVNSVLRVMRLCMAQELLGLLRWA